MAMTKKEQAELQAMRGRDAMLRAIAYPQFPMPEPIAEGRYDELQEGWTVNKYLLIDSRREAIVKQWRKGGIVYRSEPRATDRSSGSRDGVTLYATEQDANRAAAYILAEHFGAIMATVYAKCFDARPGVAKEG